MQTTPLQFVRRGEIVTLHHVPPTRTLLQLLREDLHSTDSKEGCGEGDCGACTVVLGEARNGQLHLQAVNSCIRLAHSIHGMALWTAHDLVQADGTLHPVQLALVETHGSQCGFCTPGMVMSLFALYQQTPATQPLTRPQIQTALSGNLCRCTGYRPIVDAGQHMQALPAQRLDSGAVLTQLAQIAPQPHISTNASTYAQPRSLQALLQQRASQPQAQLVAGCTDAGLWVTKLHQQWPQVIDLSRVAELRQVERYPHHIAIGAAVNLNDAFDALLMDRPQLRSFAQRFASHPIRNSGTLGGNIANGSPIGDSMPLLIALGANVVLMRWDARRKTIAHRELPLEDLYTGYRQNVMSADEVLAWIKVPLPTAHEVSRAYKISKRWEDDISAVCLSIQLEIKDGLVHDARIGVGGVAATPARARQTEAVLRGQAWNADTLQKAQHTLQAEFQPLSDLRASNTYRVQVLGQLLQRLWLEQQGHTLVDISQLQASAVTTDAGAAA